MVKTMYINIFQCTAVLRVACSHTHTLAYGSDVNEAALYEAEAEAANISPLL